MKRIIKTSPLLTFALLAAMQVVGQAGLYQWQVSLQGLKGEGYYRLLLSPDVRARASFSGADFRIVDSAGNYVPYFLHTEIGTSQVEDLTVLPLTASSDTQNENVTIENRNALQLSGLTLTLRNKAQSTHAQLTGSDDGAKWFDISSEIFLSPSSEMGADTFEQQISFPPVKYHLLRLTVKVNKSIPLNIVRAVVLKSVISSGRYSVIPSPVITQRDSAKKTYVTLDYKEAYDFDRLKFHLSGPRLYHRNLDIYSHDTSNWYLIATDVLSSTGSNELSVDIRTKRLLLVISNGDDKPLQLISAESLQLNYYLVSYLDGDRNYYLVFGNPKAEKPSYDLSYFQDSIKNNTLKEITCSAISANKIIPNTEPAKKAPVVKGLDKRWIWPVLIILLGLLFYFTLKVSKDIAGKPDENQQAPKQ